MNLSFDDARKRTAVLEAHIRGKSPIGPGYQNPDPILEIKQCQLCYRVYRGAANWCSDEIQKSNLEELNQAEG